MDNNYIAKAKGNILSMVQHNNGTKATPYAIQLISISMVHPQPRRHDTKLMFTICNITHEGLQAEQLYAQKQDHTQQLTIACFLLRQINKYASHVKATRETHN